MKNVIRSMHGTTMLFLLNKKKTEEIFILTANSRETVQSAHGESHAIKTIEF